MNARVSSGMTALGVVLAVACGGPDGAGSGPGRTQGGAPELIVFAASSLTESFGELERIFEAGHDGTDVKLSLESSSTLASQLVEGAPADVFASADEIQMDVVADEGLAQHPAPFVTNRLVVVTPEDNPARIETPPDVAKDGVKLVLAAREVPAGNYAREMFATLGIRKEAEANVVSNEEDVKAVVSKVRLGEADAGVVYRTDVTAEVEGDVELIEVPAKQSPIAVYPITVIEGTPHEAEAQDWVDLVTSPQGEEVFERYAFGIPG